VVDHPVEVHQAIVNDTVSRELPTTNDFHFENNRVSSNILSLSVNVLFHPLSFNRQHYHIDDCLDDNREDY